MMIEQFLGFAGLELLVQLVQGDTRAGASSQRSFPQLALPVFHDVPRLGLVGNLRKVVAG